MRLNFTLCKLQIIGLFIGVAVLWGNANAALAKPHDKAYHEKKSINLNSLAIQVPTITFSPTLSARPYGSANFTPATSNSTAEIIFTSDNPAVATIVNNRVHVVGVGTALITASQAANSRYVATQASATLNVIQASPVITFNNLNRVYSAVNFIAATATLGAQVIITSDNPAVATIVNNSINMVGAGTANITATITGSELYAATQATAILNVTKIVPTLTFVSNFTPRTYTTTDFSPVRTTLGAVALLTSDNPLVATIVNNQVNMVGPGKANITATIVDDNRYVGTKQTKELTVTKAVPTINFVNLAQRPFSTIDFVPATATYSAPMVFTSDNPNVATIVNNRVNMIGVGTAHIKAVITGTDRYAAIEKTATLTVIKALPVIRFAGNFSPRSYTTADFTPAVATAGATLTFTSSNFAVAGIVNDRVNMITPGTTNITATVADDDRYIGTTLTKSLTVTQAYPSITFVNIAPRPFTTADLTPATANFGAPVTFTSDNPAVATIVNNRVNMVGLGTANITGTIPTSVRYVGSTASAVLKVTQSTPVITFVNNFSPRPYSTTPFTAATNNVGAHIIFTSDNPAVATIVNDQVNMVGTGTANITATIQNSDLYAAVTATQTLTVAQRAQTIAFDEIPNKTYLDVPFNLTATATSGLPVTFTSSNETVATITDRRVVIIGVGTTTITASQAGDNGFAAAPNVTRTFKVTKMQQSINLADLSPKTYGDAPFTLTGTVTSNLPITYTSSNPQVATILNNVVTIKGGGETSIIASQPGNSNYDPAPNLTRVLTINKIDQTLAFDALAAKTYGDAPFSLTATASSGLPVSFTSSDPAVATITNGNIVTITGGGTATITATQPGNQNYNAAVNLPQTLTVNKASQTITFNTLTNKVYTDASFALNTTASSSLPVAYTSSDVAVATVNGNTVNITGVGTATITATQPGNNNYLAATAVIQPLTVAKGNQTIAFNALPDKAYADAPFTLNALASSNLPIIYTSSNPLVATVAGNIVNVVGIGTTTITASQPGNANYNTAPDASQTLTVGKANQTITFAVLPGKTFGNTAFNLIATSTSNLPVTFTSSNPLVATVNGNTVTITGQGVTEITASQTGDGNYNAAANIIQQLTIGKATQTIAFQALPAKVYGDAPISISATSTSNLPVVFNSSNPAVALVNGNFITIVGSGSAVITASQPGNSNYLAAQNTNQTLTVAKANQTIAFNALLNKALGDANFDLTASATSGLPVVYTSSNTNVATIVNGTATITGAGSAIITASQPGNENYNAAPVAQQVLVIGKANQTITFAALANKTYTDAPFTLTATATSGLPVTYTSLSPTVATVSGNTVTIVGTGSTIITASQSGNSVYNPAASVNQTLVVNPAPVDPVKTTQTITFAALSPKLLGDVPFGLTGSASSGLFVTYTSSNPAVATVSGNTVTIVGTGSTTITAFQSGNTVYEAAPTVTQTLTVTAPKSNQTITFAALPAKVFGDAPFSLTATASSGLGLSYTSSNPLVATVSGSTVTIIGVGSTTITALQTGNAAFNAAPNVTQTLTVTAPKSNQTITFAALPAKVFGDAPFSLTAAASSGLGVSYTSSNPLVATVSGSTVTIIGAGSTTITASQTGNAAFNAAPNVTQTLTVTAPKANQTITFAALPAKVFGDVPFSLMAAASSGLGVSYTSSNPLVATMSGNTITITGVGETIITASQGGDNAYNAAVNINQTLTVGKANQILAYTAIPTKTYGDAPFNLTAVATSALPITFTSSNPLVATVNGSTVTIIGAGSAIITASQAGNTNYNPATPVTQTITVNKAQQNITFNAIPVIVRGNSYNLSAVTSSSGLPVSFTVANTLIASVQGVTLTGNVIGTTTITATQPGNNNYLPATAVTQNITISTINGEVDIQVRQAVSPNGDGINDWLLIEGITKYPNNHVTVINRNGVKVFEAKGYDNGTNPFVGRSNVNGQLQAPGTYFYLVQYTHNGVGRRLTGYFVLKYQ